MNKIFLKRKYNHKRREEIVPHPINLILFKNELQIEKKREKSFFLGSFQIQNESDFEKRIKKN